MIPFVLVTGPAVHPCINCPNGCSAQRPNHRKQKRDGLYPPSSRNTPSAPRLFFDLPFPPRSSVSLPQGHSTLRPPNLPSDGLDNLNFLSSISFFSLSSVLFVFYMSPFIPFRLSVAFTSTPRRKCFDFFSTGFHEMMCLEKIFCFCLGVFLSLFPAMFLPDPSPSIPFFARPPLGPDSFTAFARSPVRA